MECCYLDVSVKGRIYSCHPFLTLSPYRSPYRSQRTFPQCVSRWGITDNKGEISSLPISTFSHIPKIVTRRRNRTAGHFYWLTSPYVGLGVCVLFSNYRLQHLLVIAHPISLELFPFSISGSLSGTFHQRLTCIFPGEQAGTWPNLGQSCTASRILNCVKGDSKSESSWN